MTRILVTGAGGFIGRALWAYLQRCHGDVALVGIDNLSRGGSCPPPLRPDRDEFHAADVCDIEALPLTGVDAVIHLAAQVAVTSSLISPWADFRTNALGSFRVAAWARQRGVQRILYASTNKVLGELSSQDQPIDDLQPLAPITPYGVSKATGGLYVRELHPDGGWVFHLSCIYGPTQIGSVDQGWVAYVARQIREGRPVVCYGDGTQVRDLLHVDDLCRLFALTLFESHSLYPAGSYVVGGGIDNAVSFAGLVDALGGTIDHYEPWRQADQHYFVSANRRVSAVWSPQIDWRDALL